MERAVLEERIWDAISAGDKAITGEGNEQRLARQEHLLQVIALLLGRMSPGELVAALDELEQHGQTAA